jgi:hypothetical protein
VSCRSNAQSLASSAFLVDVFADQFMASLRETHLLKLIFQRSQVFIRSTEIQIRQTSFRPYFHFSAKFCQFCSQNKAEQWSQKVHRRESGRQPCTLRSWISVFGRPASPAAHR